MGAPRLVSLRALLWDFDGLLLDTETSALEVARDIWAEHGLELELTTWHAVIGTATVHWTDLLADQLGVSFTDDDRERLVATRVERHARRLADLGPQPGVVELLDEAAAAGVACAVASSSTDAWVEQHLGRMGLRGRFAAIATRDLVGRERTKPHPDLFLVAAGLVDASAEGCVVLEDSPVGVAAARAASMAVVAVPGGVTASMPFPEADLTVPSLTKLDLATLERLL